MYMEAFIDNETSKKDAEKPNLVKKWEHQQIT